MGSNPSCFSGSNKPVEKVSWYDAITYCNKRSLSEGLTPCYTVSGVNFSGLVSVPTSNDATWNAASCNFSANGYRLPTEAEWEYFARGGNITNSGQTTCSGSDTIGNVAWYYENAYNGLSSSDANYGTHPVKTKAKNSLNLYDMSGNVLEWCWDWYGSISASTDSAGASSGSIRVCRGGSWDKVVYCCSVAFRDGHYPNLRNYNLGFRVVRTAD
jgi:formylglycine-generating enzyme required for sulfatase activity